MEAESVSIASTINSGLQGASWGPFLHSQNVFPKFKHKELKDVPFNGFGDFGVWRLLGRSFSVFSVFGCLMCGQ